VRLATWEDLIVTSQQIPAELERRIRALEDPAGQSDDFDGVSWAWLLALGVILPIVALIVAWSA
jgi:hypothetical protein